MAIRAVLFYEEEDEQEAEEFDIARYFNRLNDNVIVKAMTEDLLEEGDWIQEIKEELYEVGHPSVRKNEDRTLHIIDQQEYANTILSEKLIANTERRVLTMFSNGQEHLL